MLFDIKKIAMEQLGKMKPEEIGWIIISMLDKFEELPADHQIVIREKLKDILS